jgi:methionyl-tRNA synthetase
MWPADVHVVWKDIIRFHAIFWPAMLASYFDLWEQGSDGVLHYKSSDTQKLPKNILCWGHFTIDGQKISKSLWNTIEPVEYSEEYSKELLILYMLSAFPIWNDGDYDKKNAILTYNAKLANNLGNLVNRVVVLSLKLTENPGVLVSNSSWNILSWKWKETVIKSQELFSQYNLKWVLDASFEQLDLLNKFADDTQPWQTIKDDQETTTQTLYTLAEWLRQVGLALYPFFPEKMSEMFIKLGLNWYTELLEEGKLDELLNKQETFAILEKWQPLFKRIDLD